MGYYNLTELNNSQFWEKVVQWAQGINLHHPNWHFCLWRSGPGDLWPYHYFKVLLQLLLKMVLTIDFWGGTHKHIFMGNMYHFCSQLIWNCWHHWPKFEKKNLGKKHKGSQKYWLNFKGWHMVLSHSFPLATVHRRLASIGSAGAHPNHMHRDMLRTIFYINMGPPDCLTIEQPDWKPWPICWTLFKGFEKHCPKQCHKKLEHPFF